ncbi:MULTISPECIES: Fe-S cluster assembly transcription factor [Thiorhodovibrio]|jgi:Rrf2 family iron-sulfur cluster assembly transcriptional regulator|uniref:Fe-S cluster assembly transcription factor n=1 Tax=Thiorhodovibrio TaxID=61593 RepID=UPI001913B9BB|nr:MULTISPECIES: Fe-S cluster assembly transcription factor [Thiorhodovibrio]MBK5970821.1 Rrf2 family transcriptional regulator [Thiorhodovibrio winogradskyi]WPL10787.1 HTH-type transcriptional regulator IscR [Thiorhodovibrio litoralis]
MRLTTKGRYAVTAVLDLAIHQGQGPIALADIARRQGISLSYLEQLFAKLRRQRLVCSVRGPGGGYNLARDIDEINIAEVISAVDEHVDATKCGGAGDCCNEGPCLTHDLWMDLSHRIYEYLYQISLKDLVERRGHHSDIHRPKIPQEPVMEAAKAQPTPMQANA